MDIQVVAKREYKATTDSAHTIPIAKNFLDRNFTQEKPNISWVANINYIWTQER
jgi:hypothetical protein